MDKIQVFILTYNRPDKVLTAIYSVLNQSYKNIELIVSDNSSNEKTHKILSELNYDRVKYIRRKIVLNPIEHLNVILSEVTSNYFMMFHDDDEMHENMIEKLFSNIEPFDDIVAVGSNAYLKIDAEITKQKMFKASCQKMVLANYFEVSNQYLKRNGIVPFPSYLYRKIVSKKIQFNINEGGQNCDMTFIMKLTDLGKIKLLEEPLMNYFINSNNDHVLFLHKNMQQVLNFLLSQPESTNYSEIIKKMNLQITYLEIKQDILMGKIRYISNGYFYKFCKLLVWSPFNFFPRFLGLVFMRILNISTEKLKFDR